MLWKIKLKNFYSTLDKSYFAKYNKHNNKIILSWGVVDERALVIKSLTRAKIFAPV